MDAKHSKGLYRELEMFKVECTTGSYCTDILKLHGYPTILVYQEGKLLKEYSKSIKKLPLFITEFVQDYQRIHPPLLESSDANRVFI